MVAARTAVWLSMIVRSCRLGVAHLCALPILDGAHVLAPEVLVLDVQSFDLAAAGLPIRRLSPADLAACVELAADRGWPPERNKLRLLFAVGEGYGIDDPAGGLAATRARCFRAWGSAASTPSPGTPAGSLRSRVLRCPARFAPPRYPTVSQWPSWTGRYSARIAGTC